MGWFVAVEGESTTSEKASPPFENLLDATIYALDLAETIGKIAPYVPGRRVNINRDDGHTELSFSVRQGGLTGEGD